MELPFVCPLDWRYGSEEMRRLFTLDAMVRRLVEVEKAIYLGLVEAGIAPRSCLEVVEKCFSVDPREVYELEKRIGHDVASLTYILGERCGECGNYVHLGATSYDVVDTAWALAIRDALAIIKERLRRVVKLLEDAARRYIDLVMVGRTHGQHALPITLGFKFANYVYELSRSYERLCCAEERVAKGKVSGAVGTMAGWMGRGLAVEAAVSRALGLPMHEISTQVAPRDGFAELVAALAILGSSLDRLALEVRELSRPEIHEVVEVHGGVGSSTMPHKMNPVIAERVSGLAKVLRGLVITALENVPLMHERDLTNSSSERILIPHALLVADQMLIDCERMLRSLRIDEDAIDRNLKLSRGWNMVECIMVKLVEKGVPRHEAHRHLAKLARELSGERSALEALSSDPLVSQKLSPEEIRWCLEPRNYLGNYRELVERALSYAKRALSRC